MSWPYALLLVYHRICPTPCFIKYVFEFYFWPQHLCCQGALTNPRRLLIYLLPYLSLSQDPNLSLRVTVGYQVLWDRTCSAHSLQPRNLKGLPRAHSFAVRWERDSFSVYNSSFSLPLGVKAFDVTQSCFFFCTVDWNFSQQTEKKDTNNFKKWMDF